MSLVEKQIFIPIAAGFDEGDVITCTTLLREVGLSVRLVGLTANELKGLHGISICCDYSLNQLVALAPPDLVIIPGEARCASLLLADPRFHHLLQMTWARGKLVTALSSAQQPVAQAGLPNYEMACRFIAQGNEETALFVPRLINLMR